MTLSDLIKRVEQTGANYALECDIWRVLVGEGREPPAAPPAYTASVDAALALVERVLPGWQRIIGEHDRVGQNVQWRATLIQPPGHGVVAAWAPTPALALVLALLRALQAREGENGPSDVTDVTDVMSDQFADAGKMVREGPDHA